MKRIGSVAALIAMATTLLLGCGRNAGPSTTPHPPGGMQVPTEPVPILQTYLAIRRVATGSIPMLVVCDKALAGKLTSAVQENLVKTGLADSVVIDFACQGVKGEIRGNKYRQSLRITRMRIDPGVLVTFEAIAFTGFGQYHMEEYIHDEKDRKKTRLVLGDFISS